MKDRELLEGVRQFVGSKIIFERLQVREVPSDCVPHADKDAPTAGERHGQALRLGEPRPQ